MWVASVQLPLLYLTDRFSIEIGGRYQYVTVKYDQSYSVTVQQTRIYDDNSTTELNLGTMSAISEATVDHISSSEAYLSLRYQLSKQSSFLVDVGDNWYMVHLAYRIPMQ